MADYKIQIGTILDTRGIDTGINKYHQKKSIEFKSKLDTSGIDKKIASFETKKQIEVNAKLNTSGLAKKIGEYKPKTPIKLSSKLDTKAIDSAIRNYKAKTPIKVDIKLDSSDISKQIRDYRAKTPIKVDIKLDSNDITKQIRAYETKTPIKLGVKLTTKDIDEKIRNYKAKTPIKLDVKINKGVINEQIKSFNPKNTIKLKAALQKGAIAEEIRKYKPSTPIKVDLELNYSDIDKKVGEYIATKGAVELPVKLKPAKTGFSDSVTKKPVEVSATLESSDINKAIDNFNPTSKIKVDVKLNPKDINTQVKGLAKPTEPINVGIKLDEGAINADIALFKPTATLGIQPDLILENVDDQIRAYVPQTKIKVNVDLDDSDINAEAGKQKAQSHITVNVKLDREKLNEQIRNFKTQTKIKVGIKLDSKGIAEQIRKIEPKTKIKVGINLDRSDIDQQVQSISAGTPIRLGVELDPEGIQNVENQINNLRQQLQDLETISININSNIDNTVTSGGNVGSNIVNNTAQSAQQAVREVERIISSSAENSIKNVTSKGINRFFEVDPEDSNAFKREMDKLVREWTNGKGKIVGKINIETRTSYDKDTEERIERLHRAQVTYNNELGKTIQKTIEWTRIGTDIDVDGKESPIYGFAEVSAKYSDAIDKTKNKTDAFVKQQKKAVADLTNDINELNSKTIDQNASKPIKEQVHLSALETKYNEITDAITRMGSASSATFDDARNDVNRLISEYKVLAQQFKNAESVATSLRSKDIDTVKGTYSSKLDVLISKMRKDGVYTSGFERGAENLRTNLASATDASGLTAFLNGLDKLEAGYKRASAAKKEFDQSQKVGIKVSGLQSKIADLQKISPEIDRFEAEINGAKVSVQSLIGDLSQVRTQGDFSVVNERFRAFTKAAKEAGIAVTDTVAKTKTFKEIKTDIGTGNLQKAVNDVKESFNLLRIEDKNMEADITRLQTLLGNMDASDDIESVTSDYREFSQLLETVKNKVGELQRTQSNSSEMLDLKKESAMEKLNSLFEEGSQAAHHFGERARQLAKELNECGNANIDNVTKKVQNLGEEVKRSGLQTKTFTTRLKEQFAKYSSYFSVASVFMYATQGLRDMFEQVKLIDSAMTELRKVTNESDASYNRFLSNAATKAKELGTTIDGLVSSTADFARLGYGFKESQKLAEVANIYAVVGDEIDGVEGATQSLISTLAAFRDKTSGISDADFAMDIIDIFNELGNKFAISSGGLGEALERSASSLEAANNTIHESAALITAANEVVQNPEKVGKMAMPTLKMAISVKGWGQFRPRKDFISIFDAHQLGRVCVFLCNFK
jgi:hypothetical protein